MFDRSIMNTPSRIGILILCLTIISCTNKADVNSEFPPLEFDVNPDLLSSPLVVDSSFSIQMPSDWSEINAEYFEMAKQAINSDTSSLLKLELQRVFKSDQGASCVISKVVNDAPAFSLLDSNFEDLLEKNFQTDDVAKGTFSLNGNKTVQYRILNEDIVAFKLFSLIGNNLYQIDYFVPNAIYETEIRKVESSVGSIISNKNRKEALR